MEKTRLNDNFNFNNLKDNRKDFYRTLWEKDKIKFNMFTFLPILSILENKQLDSYENIYDKLNNEDAKNCIIDNLMFPTIVLIFHTLLLILVLSDL